MSRTLNSAESQLEQILITLSSADATAIGTAAAWSHDIVPLNLSGAAEYSVALVEADFTAPGNTSVFFSCSLAGMSRVGSSQANLVCRIPPQTAGVVHFTPSGNIVQWRPTSAAIRSSSNVECSLTLPSGSLITAAGQSTITIALRRI